MRVTLPSTGGPNSGIGRPFQHAGSGPEGFTFGPVVQPGVVTQQHFKVGDHGVEGRQHPTFAAA